MIYVDGWAWLTPNDLTPRGMDSLRRSLHVLPRRDDRDQRGPRPIRLFSERDGCLGIPREHRAVAKLGAEAGIIYEVSAGSPVSLQFEGRLRDDQPEATRVVVDYLQSAPAAGGILQAIGGWGKTVWAANIIATMGVTTLVMVHRGYLVNQWKRRLEAFLPGVRIGIVQQSRCELENVDVVIAMIHSLAGEREYPDALYTWPGMVITDEVHVLGADTWAPVAPRFPARWRLGLSATPRRKDGADDVFKFHIGRVLHVGKRGTMQGMVRRVWTDWAPQRQQGEERELPDFVIMRKLVSSTYRNRMIIDQLLKAMDAGRKVIVFSGQRKHLDTLHQMLLEVRPGADADFYVGGRKQEELDKAECAQVLWATYKMAKEALDIPDLDCLFVAAPIGDIEQAYYRVTRKVAGKKQPVVVDFIDHPDIGLYQHLWRHRERFYRKMKALPY